MHQTPVLKNGSHQLCKLNNSSIAVQMPKLHAMPCYSEIFNQSKDFHFFK